MGRGNVGPGEHGAVGAPIDGDRRGRVLLRIAVVAVVAGAAVLVLKGIGSSGAMIEAVAVLAVLAGTLLTLSPQRQPTWQFAGTDRAVAAGTAAAIDALDRIEHRRLELGSPWPQLVVGPTGVSIVDICSLPGTAHLTTEGLHPAGSRQYCARCDAATAAADAARRLLADSDCGTGVPVRVLAVLPPGTRVSRDPGLDDRIDAVPADLLSDRLARGPVLPMAVVERAFTRLASLAGTHVRAS